MTTLPERFIADFGRRADVTPRGVRALAAAIDDDAGGSADRSLQKWAALFRKTCGQDWPRPKPRLDRLARNYGVPHDPSRPEVVLFALHTWYVLLVKLLVGHVVAAVRGQPSTAVEVGRGNVQSAVRSLMEGSVFADLAVTDPWAGEPFDWFSCSWSRELDRAVTEAAARIAEYDPAATTSYAAAGGDLLKPLYESLFPRAVRHALGEYYTPGWLAEQVLDQVGYCGQSDARLLDPTCGSGTFLLAALRRWRVGWTRSASERWPTKTHVKESHLVGRRSLETSLSHPTRFGCQPSSDSTSIRWRSRRRGRTISWPWPT